MVKGKDLQQPYILQNDSGFLMVGAGMQPDEATKEGRIVD